MNAKTTVKAMKLLGSVALDLRKRFKCHFCYFSAKHFSANDVDPDYTALITGQIELALHCLHLSQNNPLLQIRESNLNVCFVISLPNIPRQTV